MPDRHGMLQKLGEISFAVIDLQLYLDTHPTDEQALQLFGEYLKERTRLKKEYEQTYEPLTIDCVRTENTHPDHDLCQYAGQKHFSWVDGPVPWEGGHI